MQGGERCAGVGVAVVGWAVGPGWGLRGHLTSLADVHHAVHGVHVADLPVLLVRALLARVFLLVLFVVGGAGAVAGVGA